MMLDALVPGQIDRRSPEPFYLQLTRLIETAIDGGTFRVGDRLPSETALCRHFDLARSTVRETLRALEQRKRVRSVPRRGAFVIDPDQTGWVLQVAAGFFEGEVDLNRREVMTDILEASLAPVPDEPAAALHLARGELGFRLRRLRRLDGRLALYSINYLLPELADLVRGSSAMQPAGSLNRALREAGYSIDGARRMIEAVSAPPDIAPLLDLPIGAPLLLITSVSWRKDGRVFDYYTSWVRSDVVRITVEAG
ncbi:MAG: GntR family transcriptional regulator [Labrys sp. (in: a-proteobacteria)]|jgi:GntR family transcriptional regulator